MINKIIKIILYYTIKLLAAFQHIVIVKKLLIKINKNKTMNMTKNYIFHPYKLNEIHFCNNRLKIQLMPKPRSGHRLVILNDTDIYLFGGYNPDVDSVLPLFKELWKYNIINNEWNLLLNNTEDLPTQLASTSMLTVGQLLMIYGGSGMPFGFRCSNDLYIYSPLNIHNDNKLIKINTTGDMPEKTYGQAIVYHNNYLYIIGGTNGYYFSCDIQRVSLKSRTWENVYTCSEVNDDPKGRYRHEIAYDGSHVYVFGGGTSDATHDLIDVPCFDLENNKWKYIKTKPDTRVQINGGYPLPRKCHSLVQLNSDDGIDVIIAGGYSETERFKDIWKLNLNSMIWKLYINTRLPESLVFHDAVVTTDGAMYIYGGIKGSDDQNTRTNDMLQMWIHIPKLSVICWEALQHYLPSINKVNKQKLLEIGIPLKFVNRI